MARRGWSYVIAAGGLATVVLAVGLLYATWRYASPQEPRIARYETPQAPERSYPLGGVACDPVRLNALPAAYSQTARDRCAQTQEDHRVKLVELTQAARANDLAEGNLRFAYAQARIAFAQTLATVAAFIAAGVAAFFAWRATYWTKRAANIADQSFAALERPFLVLEVLESGVEVSDRSIKYAPAKYRFNNFGRTPAIITHQHFAMTWSVPEPIDPNIVQGRRIAFGVVIGSGCPSPIYEVGRQVPLVSSWNEHKANRKRNRKEPYLIGFVRYRDLMGNEYITGFCLEHEDGAFDVSSWIIDSGEDRYNYDRKLS